MYYTKLVIGPTTIEFDNSWTGMETIYVNGRIVSQKSSVWGTHHYFTVYENGKEVRYILTSKVGANMQVLMDLRRNGHIIERDYPLSRTSMKMQRTKLRKKENKAKKKGLVKLKEYDLEEALEYFLKAQKNDAKDPEIYFHLACIYSVLEKTEEGFEALKNAKANGFKDEESILNHDMLAFLRLNKAFDSFAQSGYKEYNKAFLKNNRDRKATYTAHSEYGRIHSIFIKPVNEAFVDDITIDDNWKDLNYLGKPDLRKAIGEYQKFIELLESQQTEIHFLPYNHAVGMDSIYCRDASIATDEGMILCNMGKPQRMNEPKASKEAFKAAGIKILGEIKSPGTMEGGDVAWLDEDTLAVAFGYRSNPEGFEQLQTLLEPLGVQAMPVHLPHYKGPEDVFHLMSIFSPVDKDIAVVYSPLMPVTFRKELLSRGYKLVEVPDEEFESMGCNVLAIAPSKCLMVKGNPITKQRLEAAGCTVFEYDGQEISVKGGGGPTCLTRPILRYRE
jgi:N-dimethylarginine dimethylaminohydrolase